MKTLTLVLLLLTAPVAHAAFIDGTATLNFTAEGPDQAKWVGVSLETGATVDEPRFEAPSWQLRFLQGYVSTNGGRAAKIETADFDAVASAPADSAFTADSTYDPMGPAPRNTYNKTLMDWYEYFMLEGHLLAPKDYVFVIQTADGHFAKVRVVDYVKNGRAIRWVTGKDFLGRERKKQRSVKVGDEDGQVHVVVKYRFNTVAGDRKL